ncbi:hypothetical protein DFJ58DRAFT_876868 [Suillus subalutaceus]|uniref:uncharacterized protein n=1 Tax=Suillus subalutaceus TaxID=48586 RepID=UPI001B884CFD|nr:uncharacterized protein DFJ58DRAFT_876868 [Suillus subalutaceus]KAG1828746.1 hypothetical protein DFJ58DRAFT_876868 [Suillus subalutaceus]
MNLAGSFVSPSSLPTLVEANSFAPSSPPTSGTKKTKAKASQESAGEKTDKPLQRSSKIKALERKVWNETMANSRKCAPTVTGLQSVPAAKLARKTPAEKLDHNNADRGQEAHEDISCAESQVSIQDNDTISEYGDSDHASEKSEDDMDNDMEFPEEDDLSRSPRRNSSKRFPILCTRLELPVRIRCLLARLELPVCICNPAAMYLNGRQWPLALPPVFSQVDVADLDSEMPFQVADKASDGHSKCYYREASSTVTKHQPDKKKDKKKRTDVTRESAPELDDKESDYSFTWPVFTDLVYSADGSINLKAQNTRIQNVLKTAMFELKKASLFDNAFPNITQK